MTFTISLNFQERIDINPNFPFKNIDTGGSLRQTGIKNFNLDLRSRF